MQTQVVIVYSPNQNARRTVIIPDDDSQVAVHAKNLQPGEAVMVGSLSDYKAIGPDDMLAAFTGQKAASDRCIVVNGGLVVDVIAADPLIDAHPLGQVLSDVTGQAAVGLPVIDGVAQIPAPLPKVKL